MKVLEKKEKPTAIVNCTSIEQSKKLMELGIDRKSSDMFYWYGENIIRIGRYEVQSDYFDIPAWSLSALLELIPPYLGDFKDGIDFGFGKAMNGKWYSAHYIQFNDAGLANFTKTVTGETAVDAAFEMVCWLKENNKL